MTVRERVRAFRFYYKAHSLALYREAFENYREAWWFPFLGAGRFVPRSMPRPILVPRAYWTMLATAGRLALIGAHPTWKANRLHVSYRDLTFVAPPTGKIIGFSLKSIFVDDVWKMQGFDLAGKTVLDVGAYVGDSSLAFAARGATVHAFEPFPEFRHYLETNVRLNNLQERIRVHAVGLSDRNATIQDPEELDALARAGHGEAFTPGDDGLARGISLVDALGYFQANAIGPIAFLKLNCEGCEYALFRDRKVLEYLRPERIVMEYHQGGECLYRFLLDQRYAVDWSRRTAPKGLMYADRKRG